MGCDSCGSIDLLLLGLTVSMTSFGLLVTISNMMDDQDEEDMEDDL